MSIPWSVDRRPDTGHYNARLGMGLFLVADAMFMGALYSSLVFLRTAGETWSSAMEQVPAAGHVAALLLAIAAAVVLSMARRQAGVGPILASVVLGIAAVAVMTYDQAQLSAPDAGTAFAMVYVLNGVVRLHLLGGVAAALWFLLLNGRMRRDEPQHFINRLECLGMLAYFNAFAWLFSVAFIHLL